MNFKQPLHVGAPNIGDRERFDQMADEMFARRWLTNDGELARRFEEELKAYLGVKHCVLTCNGTTALQLAFRAMELKGEVILPSLTFVATAHALQWNGVQPVFCDVDPVSLCLDPNQVEERITPATTGILGVHVFGHPCDVSALSAVAKKHDLKLMFDAAHAFGVGLEGARVGGFGDCEVFSFHATKVFNSFEGGAVATNNDELARRVRRARNFGFEESGSVTGLGVNGKMTEICAAMGLTNLREIDRFIAANRANLHAYKEGLAEIPGLRLIGPSAAEEGPRLELNHHYVVVEVTDEFPLSRNELMARLRAENVLVRDYFWPGCHRTEPYRSQGLDDAGTLPVTEAILERVLLFPTGVATRPEQVKQVLAWTRDLGAAEAYLGISSRERE